MEPDAAEIAMGRTWVGGKNKRAVLDTKASEYAPPRIAVKV
jgi:hypothetical protein